MPIFVNRVEINDAEIGQEMQYHPAEDQQGAWQLAAQSLVIRQLLLQRAVEAGLCQELSSIRPGEMEENLIDRLLQQEVVVPEADEVTCQRFYKNHPDSFKDKQSGKPIAFSQAHANIRDYLHTKAMRLAVAGYIRQLSYNASIKGFELQDS